MVTEVLWHHQLDTAFVYLQMEMDRRGMNPVWISKGGLQADSEYFLYLGAEPMR